MRISDWSSDVCSSDLFHSAVRRDYPVGCGIRGRNRIRCDAPGRCAAKAAGYWRACCLGLDGPNISPRGTATLLSMVPRPSRSEEHTSELQSLMRNSYTVLCLKKKQIKRKIQRVHTTTISN